MSACVQHECQKKCITRTTVIQTHLHNCYFSFGGDFNHLRKQSLHLTYGNDWSRVKLWYAALIERPHSSLFWLTAKARCKVLHLRWMNSIWSWVITSAFLLLWESGKFPSMTFVVATISSSDKTSSLESEESQDELEDVSCLSSSRTVNLGILKYPLLVWSGSNCPSRIAL